MHETWQLDRQEGHRLGNGEIATVCNIRDPYGAAMIASQAFSVKTEQPDLGRSPAGLTRWVCEVENLARQYDD